MSRAEELAELVRAGVFAFVPKQTAPVGLFAIIRSVARGTVPPPAVAAARLRPVTGVPIGDVRLTPREREICALVVAGHSGARIARKLRLQQSTVDRYLRHIRSAVPPLAPKD
jgi:DNA-binding NarL/FixJ family response regulator